MVNTYGDAFTLYEDILKHCLLASKISDLLKLLDQLTPTSLT